MAGELQTERHLDQGVQVAVHDLLQLRVAWLRRGKCPVFRKCRDVDLNMKMVEIGQTLSEKQGVAEAAG